MTFKSHCMVGRNNITIDSIFADGYDAIFIGTGTALPQEVATPGHNLGGIGQSIYLLHQFSAYNEGALSRRHVPVNEGDRVGIIGCGNVAMDAARTAVRLGAKVKVMYRRTQAEMPAIESEYNAAVAEGVEFLWKTEVTEFLDNDKGYLRAARLKSSDGESIEEFDRMFLAIGSRPANRIVSTTDGIATDEKGYVITSDYPMGMTTRRGVFAGGDVVHRPQTVVLAMKAAKEVAQGIAQYVDAVKLLQHIENKA